MNIFDYILIYQLVIVPLQLNILTSQRIHIQSINY